jgi:hypothetical protein
MFKPCFVEPYKKVGHTWRNSLLLCTVEVAPKGISLEPSMYLLIKDTLLHGYPINYRSNEGEDSNVQKKETYKMASIFS